MDLNQILNDNPSLIARASEMAEEARLKWLQGKEVSKNIEATFALQTKAIKPKITITDLKYIVDNHPDIHKERLELVILESKYRKWEIEVGKLDNEFTSAKMLARLKIAEMGNLEWSKGVKE